MTAKIYLVDGSVEFICNPQQFTAVQVEKMRPEILMVKVYSGSRLIHCIRRKNIAWYKKYGYAIELEKNKEKNDGKNNCNLSGEQ